MSLATSAVATRPDGQQSGPMQTTGQPPATHARAPVALAWVAVAVLVVFSFTRERLGTNVRSRLVTVERLVDAGTWSHDGTSLRMSIDSVQIDGRRYSSKPPLYSLVLAGQAYVMRHVTGWPVAERANAYAVLGILLNQVALYAFALMLCLRWLRELTADPWTQTFAVASLTFGSLAFGYAPTLNNHTPTAALLLIAFYVDRHGARGEGGAWRSAAAGLAAGLAASVELTAAVFVPLLLWRTARARPARAALVLAGAALPIAVTALLYDQIGGSPLPFYLRRNLYDYADSYWNVPRGFDQGGDGRLLYVFHMVLGHHGLLSLSPIVGLGLVGLWRAVGAAEEPWRGFNRVVALGSAAVIAYILARTNNYGGVCMGPRWFAQLTPLLALAAVPVVERLRTTRRGRACALATLMVSSIIVVESLSKSAFNSGGWTYGLWRLLG